MLKIRLKPTGRKKRISYRVVVMERRSKRDGRAKDDLGYINCQADPPVVKINKEKLKHWVSNGAQISDGVRKWLK